MALTEGWNATNVDTLKTQVDNAFNDLAEYTTMLDNIYTTVGECWKGPDADKYLEEVYTKAKELIEECQTEFSNINKTIDAVAAKWEAFQEGNQYLIDKKIIYKGGINI